MATVTAMAAAAAAAEMDAMPAGALELPSDLTAAAALGGEDDEDAAHGRVERALLDLDRGAPGGAPCDWVGTAEPADMLLEKREVFSPPQALALLRAYGDEPEALKTH